MSDYVKGEEKAQLDHHAGELQRLAIGRFPSDPSGIRKAYSVIGQAMVSAALQADGSTGDLHDALTGLLSGIGASLAGSSDAALMQTVDELERAFIGGVRHQRALLTPQGNA